MKKGQSAKGAYLVGEINKNPQVTLWTSGSEVGDALEVRQRSKSWLRPMLYQ